MRAGKPQQTMCKWACLAAPKFRNVLSVDGYEFLDIELCATGSAPAGSLLQKDTSEKKRACLTEQLRQPVHVQRSKEAQHLVSWVGDLTLAMRPVIDADGFKSSVWQ